MTARLACGIAGFLLASLYGAGFAASAPLELERKIALGNVAGRIDHLAFDPGRQRVLVAELGNDSVGVVDIARGALIHRIAGLKHPQGVAYVAAADAIYVANAGDGSVALFKGADFAPIGRIELGDDADNIRVDAGAHEAVVGYGDGALAIIDTMSARRKGDIRLPAHPESFQLERMGTRIFVNLPDAHQIAVVDRATGKQDASWGLRDAGANFPMALDEAGARLLVVYRKPATLAVFDTNSGNAVARLPTCGDADDVFWDTKRQRIYISCGEGALAVLERRGDSLEEIARLPTVSGARTSLFVPELDRLFLAVRARGKERAALWVYRPGS